MRVTISLLTYGSLPYTKQCLKALVHNTPKIYKLVILDNKSKDDTADWIVNESNLPDGTDFMPSPKNLGYGGGHNLVTEKKGDTEFMVFLNNDTIPMKGWLEPMIEVMDKYPDCEVVGSKLISPFLGGLQHAGVNFKGTFPVHRFFNFPVDFPDANILEQVPAVTGACFMVRTKTFKELKGFDPHYFCGWEDIDYCLEINKMGKKVFYQPKSVLHHYEGRSEGRFVAEDSNREYFMKKWYKDISKWIKEENEKV